MDRSEEARLTQLLNRAARGDVDAESELWPELYAELHLLAERQMAAQTPGHTLQATALVSEAWLKLTSGTDWRFATRGHFFALAGKVMRTVLVDHAREKAAVKRGGAVPRLSLPEGVGAEDEPPIDLLALEEALVRLDEHDPELARLVELRFFAGLDHAAVAEATGRPLRTVQRRWRLAKAWLHRELSG